MLTACGQEQPPEETPETPSAADIIEPLEGNDDAEPITPEIPEPETPPEEPEGNDDADDDTSDDDASDDDADDDTGLTFTQEDLDKLGAGIEGMEAEDVGGLSDE